MQERDLEPFTRLAREWKRAKAVRETKMVVLRLASVEVEEATRLENEARRLFDQYLEDAAPSIGLDEDSDPGGIV